MKLVPKNETELKRMRAAGLAAAQVLDHITPFVQAGVTTLALDGEIDAFVTRLGAVSATKGYKGYTKASCISVNDVVCHGIPAAQQVLKEGDILNIDVTVILDGFYGDTSRMFWVGRVAEPAKALTLATYGAMMAGIGAVKSGAFLHDIGNAVAQAVAPQGYGIVRDYCGHGLGRKFHEDPAVLHYAHTMPHCPRLRRGLTFTVEPMINAGTWRTFTEDDGWTVRTADGSLSAQFEHSIAVTDEGAEILTLSPRGWHVPPYE